MATPLTITVNLESNAGEQMRQLTASITASLSGIDAKMQDTARKTGQSAEAWRTSLTGLAQATTQAMGGLGAVSQAVLQTGQAIQKAVNPFAILRKEIEGSPPAMTKMVKGLQDLAQQVIRTHAEQGNLSKAFLQTGKAAETQLTSFQKLQQSYQKTQQTAAGLTREMSSLFKGLAAAAGVSISIQGLIAFGQSVVEAGIAHDRLMLSLKGALGTAQAAGEAYAFVEQVANRLGIGLLTAVEGFAKLSAATQGTVVQGQQTRDLFVAISEASRVMGLTSAETGGIVTALTQIIGKNTVSMEELRQQLGERLPSALRLTAKEMGVTTSRFIEMVSKGEVLATDFIPAVTRAMEQMGKEAPAAAQSVQAALERVGNAWLNLKISIAKSGLLELVASIAAEMTRIINLTTDFINRSKRMAGEMGITPLVGEMQRVTQEIQRWQEILAEPNLFGPREDEAKRQIKALETQRDTLAENIRVKQKALEIDEKARKAAEAGILNDEANIGAKQKEIALVSKATTVWTGNAEAIKQNELALKALRSMDVDILQQAFQIDPYGMSQEELKVRLDQAEAILLKQQKELLDKRAGLNKGAAAREIREAGESAVERAKAVEEALATSLQRQERQIEISADIQRQAIAEATSTALATEGPGAVEAIAAEHARQMQAVAEKTADALETLRQGELTKQAAAREVTLKAEIEASGKNTSARVKAEEELRNLPQETENQRAKIRKQSLDADQKTAEQRAQAEIKHARDLTKLIREIEDERIQARIDLVDEQIGLIEAQVQGEVLTVQEGQQQIQALEAKRFDDLRLKYTRAAQEQIAEVERVVQATVGGEEAIVQAKALAAGQIEQINQGLTTQLKALDVQQQTQQQQHQNELTQGWREWVRDVKGALGNFLFDWMNGEVDSIKDVLDGLKNYFFRLIAQMVAHAATNAIVIPIVGAVLGGLGGAGGAAGIAAQVLGGVGATGSGGGGGGGLLDTLGLGVTGAGLAKHLYSMLGLDTLIGSLKTGFMTLGESLFTGIDGLFGTAFSATEQAARESALLLADLTGDMGRGVAGAAGGGIGAVAGIAGGLAALGGGIYAALNASNAASKAAFAASAAAGAAATAVAAYGAITGAAVVTAGGTGWTGIGLIVAAVMAVIGTVLDKVIKPEGPTVAVGAPGGLNVGTADGKLQLQGDAGSRVFRREGVDREFARGIQAQLEEGITSAAVAAINTINAIAMDPEALLGPTQAALQSALKNVATINSSNAKKMEQDLTEQLRFANIQLVGGLLEPINLAFDQLRDMGDLEEQIQQLPGKTSGLIAIFTNLRTQLDEIGASRNTDVLRQLSAVRNQVENFGNRIAGTAAQVAESIVTQTIEAMKVDVAPKLADQITQFAGLMDESFRALNTLRATKTMLEGAGLPGGGVGSQVDRLSMAMSEQAGRISKEIVTGALDTLATELQQVLVQPIAIQATTINSLFTDSLAALNALFKEWHRLEEAGIDATAIQGEFERLLGGVLEGTFTAIREAFDPNAFSDFLAVLLAIPPELAKMNPELERLRTIGTAFATVVGPNAQRIAALEAQLRSPAETAAATATQMADLRAAIADAGDSADKALPLYGQLSAAVVANAEAQIAAIQEIAQAWHAAMDQVESDIATFEDALGGMGTQLTRAIVEMRVSADAFHQAVASGDTLGAIEAIHEYEQAVIAVAELQIQAIQEIAQAWHSAMDQVTSDIDALEEALHGVDRQLTRAIIDMRVQADAFNQAVARGDTLGAIQAIEAYERAVVEVGNLQIRQIEEQRRRTIQAQQDIIDGLQRQMDVQQTVVDAWQDQIDVQQDFMNALQEIIAYRQEEVNALQEIEAAQDARVQALRQEERSLRALRDRVDDLTRASLSPAQQPGVIRSELARTRAELGGAQGEDAIRLLEKMVSLNQELMQLGEQTDNLALVKEGMDNLRVLQVELNKRVAEQTTELDLAFKQWEESRLTRIAAENQLKHLEAQFAYQEQVLKSFEERKQYEQHVLDNLAEQREYQEHVLANLEKSSYWDEQIAAVQASVLNELYNIQDWLSGVQGPTTWEQQIAAIQERTLGELYNVRLWLAGVMGETSWEQQIKDIQYAALIELKVIERDLGNLFRIAVGQSPIFAQRGGIVGLASGLHYAQGGMVPVMAEPGESHWSNLSSSQDRALASVNAAFPRFASGGIVPGFGSGDTVPMWVQPGTRFVNRTATSALGFQSGGMVHGSSSPSMPPIVIDLRGSTFGSPSDAHKVRDILEKDVIRIMEEYQKKVRVNTRIR